MGLDSSIKIVMEQISPAIVELQHLPLFGCTTGMPGWAWRANDDAIVHIHGLVQEGRNYSWLAMELHLSCTKPSI